MGQSNSKRVSHDVTDAPNLFRDDHLKQIVNDLGEEDSGAGFTELIKTGVFTDQIKVWTDASKTQLRSDTVISRTGVFTNSIVKSVYDEDGVAIIATSTVSFTRDASNFVIDLTVVNTRP